ncbi:MAG: RsbS, negative regulator of sigma-B, partial [uncultured Friedmanniella sp.]
DRHGAGAGLDPAAGLPADRLHPHRPGRHPDGAVPAGPRAPDRGAPGPRGGHRRRGPRRAGLLRLADAARHRRDGPAAGGGHGDRRDPAGGRLHHGRPGHGHRQRAHRARPRGGPGLPRRREGRLGDRDAGPLRPTGM